MPQHVHNEAFIIRPPDDLVERLPQLRHLSRQLANVYADKQVVTDEQLAQVGGMLWGALELDEELKQAQATSGTGILPIVIESKSSAIMALPWETLYHPTEGFFGREQGFTLSRRYADSIATPPPLEKGPLRVLLFTSLPDDLPPDGRLNVKEEQARVQEALMPLIVQGVVNLAMPDDGRFSTFAQLLQDFQPHLLFLSGHGSFQHQPHTGEAPYGTFLFESETGKSRPVRDSEIAEAFVGTAVQIVVLSACESGKTASDVLTNGLMQKISAQGVPQVIGMRESVFDKAGIQFAETLCAQLAQAERADVSLQAARKAITRPFAGISRRDPARALAAELSFGQWALPMLLSPAPERPLIDWDFAPEKKSELVSKSLSTIALPARFVGRRKELRERKSRLFDGSLKKLLIIGAGGQGKTSLAGKLALDLQRAGYRVFAWSARMENPWSRFELSLVRSLGFELGKEYEWEKQDLEGREEIELLLDFLNRKFDKKVVFFLDNLESLQDPQTLALEPAPERTLSSPNEVEGVSKRETKDGISSEGRSYPESRSSTEFTLSASKGSETVSSIKTWIDVLLADSTAILLATSRWELPNWTGETLPLAHTSYGDFLQMAQNLAEQRKLPGSFSRGEKLYQIYKTLGGNGRGLDFFAGAVKLLDNAAAEEAFLQKLAESKAETQADMAIAVIYEHLDPETQTYLRRLLNFQQPVPIEGLLNLSVPQPPSQPSGKETASRPEGGRSLVSPLGGRCPIGQRGENSLPACSPSRCSKCRRKKTGRRSNTNSHRWLLNGCIKMIWSITPCNGAQLWLTTTTGSTIKKEAPFPKP